MEIVIKLLETENITINDGKYTIELLNDMLKEYPEITKENALHYLDLAGTGIHITHIDGIGKNLSANNREKLKKYINSINIFYNEGKHKFECFIDKERLAEQFDLLRDRFYIEPDILFSIYPEWEVVSIYMDKEERDKRQFNIIEKVVEDYLAERGLLNKMLKALEFEIAAHWNTVD